MTRREAYASLCVVIGIMSMPGAAICANESANTAESVELATYLRYLEGWPIATVGGSSASPPILTAAHGKRFVVYNQFGERFWHWYSPWLGAADEHGNLLSGWLRPSWGSPLWGVAVQVDDRGRATHVICGGRGSSGKVSKLAVLGLMSPGWPQPPRGDDFRGMPSLGDFDGDGEPEVLAAADSGQLYVWRQDGSSFPGWPQELPDLENRFQGKGSLAAPAAADLNGDGIAEFVTSAQGGIVAVYDRFGRLREGWPRDVSLETRTPLDFVIVPLGDGTRGVAIGTDRPSDTKLLLFDHAGATLPGWPQGSQGGVMGSVAAGDLDGDGEPELIAGDSEKIWVFHLDGTLGDGWPVDFDIEFNHAQPLVADVSGDGAPDVLLLAWTFGGWAISAWHGNGSPIEGLGGVVWGEEGYTSPTLGDLDADGLLDMTLATISSTSFYAPGRIHAFSLGIPMDRASMHWPTHAHDYQRTSTWTLPTRLFGGGGIVAPARLREDLSEADLTLDLDVPIEAPANSDLMVTALDGLKIPPEPIDITYGPESTTDGRQVLSGAVNAAVILAEFEALEAEHPELLLTDDEIRVWLDTGEAPAVPPGEIRTLWLRVESPRLGVDKLKAHVPMELCRVMTSAGLKVYGVGGASCGNQAPVAVAAATTPVECSSSTGALVNLDGSASSDPDSILEPDDDIVSYEWFEDYGLASEEFLGTGSTLDVVLPLGPHVITLRVEDLFREMATDEIMLQVVDTVPPEIGVGLFPNTLWPPNHRLVDVRATVTATDICGTPAVILESISSNEPIDAGDIVIPELGTVDYEFQLRAERLGSGSGRTYLVTYLAVDSGGNETRATAEVVVPHDQRNTEGEATE